jgi:hypothetical protein
MAKPEPVITKMSRQQQVLAALQAGVRTWDELRAQTKLKEEGLGFTIGELLDLRQIWTLTRGDVRVYGLERRTGLVSRFAHAPRRADDLRT